MRSPRCWLVARAFPVRIDGGVLEVRSVTGDEADPLLDEMRARVGAYDVTAARDAEAVRHLLVVYARHMIPRITEDAVSLLDAHIDLAVGSDASDVHLEAGLDGIRVRQRIDGDLHDIALVPPQVAAALIARTKVRAGLDVAERRLPQDGRLTHELPDGALDVRVATMPTHVGERVTLRLLPDTPAGIALDSLGLPGAVVAALERAAEATDGLIVVCGPTGSGKTTTLHALLTLIATRPRNVMTLEDPVERVVAGTSQTQVATQGGLTFATGLRHVLRHDPDVLLVGEVRDAESARLAVEAAQTGHLVLTSLHAVDVPSAVLRLRELGVGPGPLADTLRLVVAQRLLALPCPDCAREGPSGPPSCTPCGGTGTRGRRAIAESLDVDPTIRALLRSAPNPGTDHDVLSAAVGPRLRTVALDRIARGLARPAEAILATPEAGPAGSSASPSARPGVTDPSTSTVGTLGGNRPLHPTPKR